MSYRNENTNFKKENERLGLHFSVAGEPAAGAESPCPVPELCAFVTIWVCSIPSVAAGWEASVM